MSEVVDESESQAVKEPLQVLCEESKEVGIPAVAGNPPNSEQPTENQVCRDFSRGVCKRGKKCKFFHPPDVTESKHEHPPTCKDFLTGKCFRNNCKYYHPPLSQDARYPTKGLKRPLSSQGYSPYDSSYYDYNQMYKKPNTRYEGPISDEICKDFLNQNCFRGPSCRYKHPDATQELDLPMYYGALRDTHVRNDKYGESYNDPRRYQPMAVPVGHHSHVAPLISEASVPQMCYMNPQSSSIYDPRVNGGMYQMEGCTDQGDMCNPGSVMSLTRRIDTLVKENEQLKKEVMSLKMQNEQLRAGMLNLSS